MPEHCFSSRHKRKMKRLFNLYNKNSEKELSFDLKPVKRFSFAFIIISIIIILTAVSTVAIGIYTNLSRKERNKYTELLVIEYENAPEKIDYIYALPILSDEYEVSDQFQTDTHYIVSWQNTKTGNNIMLFQTVKKEFVSHLDNEHGNLETVFINEKSGLYIDWSEQNNGSGYIVWDNGDYILEIVGDLTKEELFVLAENTKISEKMENNVTNE